MVYCSKPVNHPVTWHKETQSQVNTLARIESDWMLRSVLLNKEHLVYQTVHLSLAFPQNCKILGLVKRSRAGIMILLRMSANDDELRQCSSILWKRCRVVRPMYSASHRGICRPHCVDLSERAFVLLGFSFLPSYYVTYVLTV